ncbi:hypothetical protein [Novosphingobium sp. FKTRR1]|uniref:hypothetical protein n=1 Tax=Novosphingobium sp. FKTRR1 TaxID=2879118 RepID=UPI001CF09498|nr:hypothetical protein [Novosphingobium sp. FKTRR1]
MATYYLDQFVGVVDGSQIPANKADGRYQNAKTKETFASKVAGQAWASGDVIYAGRLPANCVLREALGITDTTLGTATLSLGTLAAPTKYVNAKTLTAVDVPTALGPKGAQAAAAPNTVDEDLYWTVGTTTVASGTNLTLGFRFGAIG